MDPVVAARELFARRTASRRLLEFTEYTHPHYEVGTPHKIIAEALDRVLSGEIDRLMLCVPPRHGKSELASRRFPAFALGRFPEWQIISASATQDLADDFGRDVRNILSSPDYSNLFDTKLAPDSQARGKWNTEQGGAYYAVGVGGAILGRGGHLIIIDDPYSTWADAQSENTRKQVWDWYCNTIYNRQMDGARIIVINHRMHEDDLCGQLLEAERNGGDQWHVIKLPAVTEGKALWPERYPIDALERIRVTSQQANPAAWSALYQQDPTPEDGEFFKREWFRYYDQLPESLNIYMSGDFAATPGGGDYTSLMVWGVDHLGNCYALDRWTKQSDSAEWTWQLVRMMQRWKPWAFVGEGGPVRRGVEPFLVDIMNRERTFCQLVWLPTMGGDAFKKAANCRPFQGLTSCGRVYWPKVDWAHEVISFLLKFPGGKRDDDVDACGLFGRHIMDVWDANKPAEPPQPIDWRTQPALQMGEFFKMRKRA